MNTFRIPFLLLITAIVMNIASACSGEQDAKESNIQLMQRNMTREEIILAAANDIYTLIKFSKANAALLEEHKAGLEGTLPHDLFDFLRTHGFSGIDSIKSIEVGYKEHLEKLQSYIIAEQQEKNLLSMEETTVFKELNTQLNILYLTNNDDDSGGGGDNCFLAWQNDMQDCRDVALIGSTVSILGAAAGLIPGLIAAGATMWEFSRCKAAAQRDYELCMQQQD